MNARAKPFSYLDCLRRAEEILSKPPAREWISRVPPCGGLVARFALPLSVCPTLNEFAEMPSYERKKRKATAGALMLQQNNGRRHPKPLPGRPQALAVRFSSQEPDRDSAWCKFAIDRLTVDGGLGFLIDDKPKCLDLHHWWEPIGPKQGFALIMLYDGVA